MAHRSSDLSILIDLLKSAMRSENLEELLHDLLTTKERKELVERWRVVSLLLEGHPQREIARRLGVGIATVTRGAKQLRDGTGAFKRLYQGKNKPPTSDRL